MKNNETTNSDSELLMTDEAAALLRISRRQIQDLMYAGKIGFVKFNRSVRFTKADIALFIDSSRQTPSPHTTKP